MKSLVLTFIASASVSVLGGVALAQEHDHGLMTQEAASSMPTMEDCRSMHHEMMASHPATDAAADAPATSGMEGMSEAMRERMSQCHSMMEAAHDEDAATMRHDGASAMHHHESATDTDDAGHEQGESSQPH
ncbi:hypothetical protein [Maricaulis sp.]|tara:strand:+ start:4217 stop:4612 length:396 start_codon:yes stop_codon:yes gene_type:complete